jgi:uncharacterized phage infection (PIP) family protein YhgE
MNTVGGSVSSRGLRIKRILGASLMIFSVLGLVISLLGLVVVCRFSGPVAASADDALDIAIVALSSTKQNLDLAHRALGEARVALGATQTFTEGAGDGLENTSALLGTLSDVLLGDLPNVIEDSQRSLDAAEEAATVIENVLYGLNAISGLTGLTYDPDVSLTESFAGINESLDAIPDTLAELDDSLNGAQENLDDIQMTVTELTGPLNESEVVLAEAQMSLEAYSILIEHLSQDISGLQESLPNWIRGVVYSLYFLLLWLAVSQIGLLWQGWEMVSQDPGSVERRIRELEVKLEALTH